MEAIIEAGEPLGGADAFEGAADSIGDMTEGLDSDAAQTQEELDKFTEQETNITKDEIEASKDDTPAQVQQTIEGDLGDTADANSEEEAALKKEGEDPESAKAKAKTFLSKAWKGAKAFFETGAGKMAVEAVGSYFKYKMIFDFVNLGQKDIQNLLSILGKVDTKNLTPEEQATLKKVKTALQLTTGVSDVFKALEPTMRNISTLGATTASATPGTDSPNAKAALAFESMSGLAVRKIQTDAVQLNTTMSKILMQIYNANEQFKQIVPKEPQSAKGFLTDGLKCLIPADFEKFVEQMNTFQEDSKDGEKGVSSQKKTLQAVQTLLRIPAKTMNAVNTLDKFLTLKNKF